MEERIQQRIAELEQAEIAARMRLAAVQTVLAELRALLSPAPEQPHLSGDDLGEQAP